MAGLLDFLDSDEGRLGLGLLMAGGQRSDGAGFGQRISEGMNYAKTQKDNDSKRKFEAMKMQEAQQQMDDRKAQTAEAMRVNGLIANFGAPRQAIGEGPQASGGMSPGMQGGQQQERLDYSDLARLNVPHERIKHLFEASNFGRPEVARTMKGMGPDGREVETQFDKFGGKVGDSVPQYRAPISVNQGNRTTFADPYNLKPVAEFQTFQDANSAASNATSMRGQNMTDARARERMAFDKAGGGGAGGPDASIAGFGKPPIGYRYKPDGSMEAIPGGPADLKANAESAKRSTDSMDVLGILDQAKPLLKKSTSSYGGAAMDQAARVVGIGTDGANAAAQLKALEGALISKMPKMSGPQSDKDVLLYKQMAGQIGDSTIPASTREAAITTIRSMNEKYASPGQAAPGKQVVKTGLYGGKKVVQYSDGSTEYAN